MIQITILSKRVGTPFTNFKKRQLADKGTQASGILKSPRINDLQLCLNPGVVY
jgi:hypothetical protein